MPASASNPRLNRFVTLSNSERVMDRFIPKISSHQTYHALSTTSFDNATGSLLRPAPGAPGGVAGVIAGINYGALTAANGGAGAGGNGGNGGGIEMGNNLEVLGHTDQFIADDANNAINNDIYLDLRDDHVMVRSFGRTDNILRDVVPALSDHEETPSGNGNPVLEHKGPIAEALGFTHNYKRVLDYTPSSVGYGHNNSFLRIRGFSGSSAGINSSGLSGANSSYDGFSGSDTSYSSDLSPTAMSRSKANKKKNLKSSIPFRVLDAPGLRDDFYSNLVSWSKKTGNIAVALCSNVFIWSQDLGAIPLAPVENDLITCVSYSNDDYLVVGTKHGRLILYSQKEMNVIKAYYLHDKGLCCITWFSDSKTIFTGDEAGEVSCFEIISKNNGEDTRFHKSSAIKYHQQQICGIALSNDSKQLAIGGNDNCCTIWNISNINRPKLKFALPHRAAVKAISFCPWSTSLLATGGGSKDRVIRFWHTNTGTLLDFINTKGQITSLIWSRSKKQIVATFGFSDSSTPVLLAVYNYPKLYPVVQVPSSLNLRALTGVSSPDGNSICFSANDETIRFYELWSETEPDLVAQAQEGGIFGSELLELSENVIITPNIR